MGLKHRQEDEALSPGEIAAAICRIEARQTDGPPRGQETILAEVLQQISPEISAEEVQSEISAQRAINAGSRRRTRRVRVGLASVFAAVIVGGMVVSASTSAPEQALTLYSLTWPEVQQRVLTQDTDAGRPTLRTLAEVPDHRVVAMTAESVIASVMDEMPIGGTPEGEPIWHVGNDPSEMTWHVFKLDNHLYVRGWTRERLSASASKIGPVEVYNTPTAPGIGAAPVQVSVRLTPSSEFRPFSQRGYEHPRGQPWERFIFSNIQNDGHTWEKW